MPWIIVERLGRAGNAKQQAARQRQWDRVHGPDRWAIGYVIDGAFVLQEEAIRSVYQASYDAHFQSHPADLAELLSLAKSLRNPHAEATGSVDLQTPAILSHLARHGLVLAGTERVDIGTWDGQRSHPISVRLSPLQVRCALDPRLTLEQWWQSKKRLAVWEDG